jgi:XTP/dITP diphosphohydrolase
MKQLVYATTNPGKVKEVSGYLEPHGWLVKSLLGSVVPADFDVEETGSTLEENALLKVNAYAEFFPNEIVLADDTGVEIDALNGEPGIYVRRWRDRQHKMSDEEIIQYSIERLLGVPEGQRGAQFRSVTAVKVPGKEAICFDGILRGSIAVEPIPQRFEGFPFESIFYLPEEKLMLGDLHQIPAAQRPAILSHRESSVQKVVEFLNNL